MKKIVFLIIASLLVVGLVLPGCDGNGEEEVIYTFEGGEVIVGICTDIGYFTGDMALAGAAIAANEINGPGINIGGVAHNLSYVKIDTDEATVTTGVIGAAALQAAINADSFDFLMGSFQTSAVQNYREVAMDAHKIFFDCGCLTNALQQGVVTNYARYKYWFKFTPYTEHFLAMGVLKLLNSVAIQYRAALGLAPGANLTAVIIAENLPWANAIEGVIRPGLPALNIALNFTYFVSDTNPATTLAALASIDARGYNPHIIISIYSGTMGVVYAGTVATYCGLDVLCPMSVGINVPAQLKLPWAAGLANPNPAGGAYCAYNVILDTYAEGVSQTSKTAAFLTTFMTWTYEYPMYSTATYDACYALKACLEDVGYVEGGVGKAKADDIIAWFEDPAHAQVTTTGLTTYYPPPGTTAAGTPALSKTQKELLYGVAFPYIVNGWLMPPHTTHDLVYGPGKATTIGAQWQWVGNETVGQWKKVGVWPQYDAGMDAARTDQYGNWNFAYTGTVDLVIPQNVIDHHTP